MRGALEAGGNVVGILADGLEKAAIRREHREALMDGRLALICPYDPAARFNVVHAMQRNKLIYASAGRRAGGQLGLREGRYMDRGERAVRQGHGAARSNGRTANGCPSRRGASGHEETGRSLVEALSPTRRLRELFESTGTPRTVAEIVEELRFPERQIRGCLKRLLDEGVVEKVSPVSACQVSFYRFHRPSLRPKGVEERRTSPILLPNGTHGSLRVRTGVPEPLCRRRALHAAGLHSAGGARGPGRGGERVRRRRMVLQRHPQRPILRRATPACRPVAWRGDRNGRTWAPYPTIGSERTRRCGACTCGTR